MGYHVSGMTLHPFGKWKLAEPCFDKALVGGKGAHLIEMSQMGLPVPPGIVIPTTECNIYLGNVLNPGIQEAQLGQLADAVITFFETRVFPDLGYMPLLAVRSGARASMPGMMDTILNLGLNKGNWKAWADRLGDTCMHECYTRLDDTYKALVGGRAPHSLKDQLVGAIGAVFNSWNSERAKEYRKRHAYPDDWGTAVTVQAMVFGNLNERSCSGVLFTRDPATGDNFVTGEFLPEAQGEDVVAGIRTPRPLHLMEQWNNAALDELLAYSEKLEAHYRDAQDIEFTIQDGTLYILQTRAAKRSAVAAFVIAHDMATEKLITKQEAVGRVTADQYRTLLHPVLDPVFTKAATFKGLAASPGVVTGRAAFSEVDLKLLREQGESVVLIRKETSPDDFPLMVQSAAILTSTGGETSHAAVVARGINKPAVVGATELDIDGPVAKIVRDDGKVLGSILSGDLLSLDGSTGNVWMGRAVPLIGGKVPKEAVEVIRWATSASRSLMAHEVTEDGVLPDYGRVYLSVGAFSKKAQFSGLLKKLTGLTELTGVIGFSRPVTELSPDDEKFLSFFHGGKVTHQPPKEVAAQFLKAMLASSVPQKTKKRWTVHMPVDATDAMIEEMTAAGWTTVRSVKTLKDLLSARGYVVFADDFRVRLSAEKVKLEDMLALCAQAGRTIRELGSLVSKEDFVIGALGK